MKRSMVLVGVILVLSACGKQQEATAPEAAAVAPAAEVAAPVEQAAPAAASAQPQ